MRRLVGRYFRTKVLYCWTFFHDNDELVGNLRSSKETLSSKAKNYIDLQANNNTPFLHAVFEINQRKEKRFFRFFLIFLLDSNC